jgi:DNA-binding beta-propeller fold protein YncE
MTRQFFAFSALFAAGLVQAQSTAPTLPNMGQDLAPQGTLQPLIPDVSFTGISGWQASQAVSTVVSPLGDTLLVLTSGYNRIYTSDMVPPSPPEEFNLKYSNEYVFVYDISHGAPVYKQTLAIPNAYNGIVFDPSGLAFYVSGGPPAGAAGDVFHVFILSASTGTWIEPPYSPVRLGHLYGNGLNVTSTGPAPINEEVAVFACAAGIALSTDGNTMVVVNYYNDSITVLDKIYGTYNWIKRGDRDLRPGKSNPSKAGVPGGEYPFWAAVKGKGLTATAYVSSVRDREIDVVSLGPGLSVTARIPVKGQPNKMTLNKAQSLLFVAEDQSDTIDVIDTTNNTIKESIKVIASMAPSRLAQYTGANPNSVVLSPDESQLYVTDGNLNCISVIALNTNFTGDQVVGLIPTGWYPNSASFSSDGHTVYVVNSKSATGPNPGWCYGGYGPVGYVYCAETNEYNPQLTKAGLQTFPLPSATELTATTQVVLANDHFSYQESASDAAIMEKVRASVKHVIFILKENRTYDQVLGDLPSVNNVPDGDKNLVLFGAKITPNQHAIAQQFVALDHFLATAEVSADGWLWSTAAQAPEVNQRDWPVAYAYRGLGLDLGVNRNVNVALTTVAERQKANLFTSSDPDILPGQSDIDAPDGPNNEINTGFLWNDAQRAGLTVRSYGFLVDSTRYFTPTNVIPLVRNAFATGTQVAFSVNAALAPFTDPYFRGFDNALPDFYRYAEWAREFDANYASNGTLPELSLVRFMHDHTGSWAAGPTGLPPAAIDGVNTPELMVADNDYAVGLLVQKIANSMYADNTLIFAVEDDAQDGGDHLDSHRTTAYIVGPYVKQGAVVQTWYNTINFMRTMEEVLGLPPMNLNDALARPMTDVFDTTTATPRPWTFTAAPSAYLYNTQLMLPPRPAGLIVPKSRHNAKYWAHATRGLDFTDADRVDSEDFNRILWKGMMGRKPYPGSLDTADSPEDRH